jgi:chorismate mutase
MQADPELTALRAEIDALDRALVDLLAQRRAVVRRIAQHKHQHHLPALDAAREAELLAATAAYARERGVPEPLVREVLAVVLLDSRPVVMHPGA